MLGHGCKTGDPEIRAPPNTDADRATAAVQGNGLPEQAFHHRPVFFINHAVGSGQATLAATVLALMVLLASVDMAIFLEHLGSTLRTRLSHTHTHGHR